MYSYTSFTNGVTIPPKLGGPLIHFKGSTQCTEHRPQILVLEILYFVNYTSTQVSWTLSSLWKRNYLSMLEKIDFSNQFVACIQYTVYFLWWMSGPPNLGGIVTPLGLIVKLVHYPSLYQSTSVCFALGDKSWDHNLLTWAGFYYF